MTARDVVLLAMVLAAACRGPGPPRDQASCTHLQAVRELRGAQLCEDVWTCTRPPGGPFDRLGLRRLALCEQPGGPIVLYLPGMHMNGDLPITDPRHDLRLYLAVGGVRTWGLDYRSHAVPAGASAPELEDLGAWTAEVFLDDAAWAAAFVRGRDPGPLHVAGFSFGAALAYRLAARPGEVLSGLLILDGALPAARASGVGSVAVDVGGSRLPFAARQSLLAAVRSDPGGPSPVAGYATAGAALTELLYSAPSFGGRGGLANARDGVSDVRALATLLASYDRWWPRAALATTAPPQPERPIPVLAFASTNLGADWVRRVRRAAEAYGGPQATVRELPRYGHLDVLVGRNAARDVFEPSLAWLREAP
jgi:pimeloyl-ACP methyl ester carboxylesterase